MLEQILKKESSFVKRYEYKFSEKYKIAVTKIDTVGIHVEGIPVEEFKYEAPKIYFSTPDAGDFVFMNSSVSPLNVDDFSELMKEAVEIYKIIKEHFEDFTEGKQYI